MAITHYDNDASIPTPTRIGETISVGPNRVLYKCWVLDPPIYNILTIDNDTIYVPPPATDTETGAALYSTIITSVVPTGTGPYTYNFNSLVYTRTITRSTTAGQSTDVLTQGGTEIYTKRF